MEKLKIAILQDRLNRVEQSRYNDPDLQSPIKNHVAKAAQFLLEKPNAYGVNLTAIAKRAATTTTYALQCFVDIERFVGSYIEKLSTADQQEWLAREKAHPNNPDEQLRSWIDNFAVRLAANPDAPLPLPVESAILLYDHHRERETIQQRKTALRDKLAELANDPIGERSPEILADKLIMLAEGAAVMRAIFSGEEIAQRFSEAADDLLKRYS